MHVPTGTEEHFGVRGSLSGMFAYPAIRGMEVLMNGGRGSRDER